MKNKKTVDKEDKDNLGDDVNNVVKIEEIVIVDDFGMMSSVLCVHKMQHPGESNSRVRSNSRNK